MLHSVWAESDSALTQLLSAWPTLVIATPIVAALIANLWMQVLAKVEAVKAAKLAAEKVMLDAETAEAALLKVDAATKAAEEAVRAAQRAAEIAHSAVTRSVWTEKAAGVERKATADKLDETLKVVNVVHKLVNNDMHLALFAAATLARKLASATGRVEDEAVAVAAEQKLADHDDRQKTVDRAQEEAIAADIAGKKLDDREAPQQVEGESSEPRRRDREATVAPDSQFRPTGP
jgi:hypothetical protein